MGNLFTRNSSFIYTDDKSEKVLLDLSDYMRNKSHLPFHSMSGDRTVSDIIVSLIILAIVGLAIYYIVKEKRKGNTCIGCPMSGKCPKKRN